MATIKQRRLSLPVRCQPGTNVGDYVPFYFCPRSVMLYVIYMRNHPQLTYRGGQEPILHLEADLHEVARWAGTNRRKWAFTLSNAGAGYTESCNQIADLDRVNWPAVEASDFRDRDVQEGKQAEFLVHGSFPWELVRRIGVHSAHVEAQVDAYLTATTHRPKVEIIRDWYY